MESSQNQDWFRISWNNHPQQQLPNEDRSINFQNQPANPTKKTFQPLPFPNQQLGTGKCNSTNQP